MIQVIDGLNAACSLCAVMKNGAKEKPVFRVQGQYTGIVCGPHLHNLAIQFAQQAKLTQDEGFDGARR